MRELDENIAIQLGSALISSHGVGGGCIHDARCLVLSDGRRVFVKSGLGSRAELLSAERKGLELLSPHIRVPAVWGHGCSGDSTWLALEWLELHPLDGGAWRHLGRSLALLHSVTEEEHGLDHDNFIGATPQLNRGSSSWHVFYQNCRLLPQLELAARNRHVLPVSKILSAAATLLADHEPRPALLHGDLWSGNTASLADGNAVVFDPAPYFGDPETDLAMLELFGGNLANEFLEGYGPLAEGRERRRPLYDLYHALNHLNLFGSGYSGMVRRCLAGIGVE
jgi:protein-ribulosamine 3-kinase